MLTIYVSFGLYCVLEGAVCWWAIRADGQRAEWESRLERPDWSYWLECRRWCEGEDW